MFAAHHLRALIESEHEVVAVYTQPDRPAGRGKKLTASAVKSVALEHGLPVEQPASLKGEDAQAILRAYQADVMVVVAYGLLLPQVVLDTPRLGCLNVHGSLLPRWRGAAPIQRAIEAGDTETGITIMQMDKGLDTGEMLLKVPCPIEPSDTSAILHDKLMALGVPALLEVLMQLSLVSMIMGEEQEDALACYADKITKQEAQIIWDEPAETVVKKIHAFNPFPVAYTWLDNERIKVYSATVVKKESGAPAGQILSFDENGLQVACGHQSILIHTLQMPNKKAMAAQAIHNGYSDKFVIGQLLAQPNAQNH